MIESGLDDELKIQWGNTRKDQTKVPEFSELMSFLEKRAANLEYFSKKSLRQKSPIRSRLPLSNISPRLMHQQAKLSKKTFTATRPKSKQETTPLRNFITKSFKDNNNSSNAPTTCVLIRNL